MNTEQAKKLVHKKFAEERKGETKTETAKEYQKACKEFPVTMQIAVLMFGMHHFGLTGGAK